MKSTHHLGRHLRVMFATAILGALASFTASAQISFQKSYDNGAWAIHSQCVRQTKDSGYVQTGFIEYWGGATNVVLHKTDSTGTTQWIKQLYSATGSSQYDKAYSVREVPAGRFYPGGYVVVGTTRDASTNNDVLVIRTDSLGNVIWRKAYQTAGEDVAYDVDLMPSDEYWQEYDFVLTGQMKASGQLGLRLMLMRIDHWGNTLWCKRYGLRVTGNPASVGYAVSYLPASGDIVVAGSTEEDYRYAGSRTLCVMRTDGRGTRRWAKVYYTPENNGYQERLSVGRGIFEAVGGDIVVTGWVNSFSSTLRDAFVTRLYPNSGNVRWFNRYDAKSPSTSSYEDFGFNTREKASNGDLILAGVTDFMYSSSGGPYVFLANLDGFGAVSTLYPPQRYKLETVADPIFSSYASEASVSMSLARNGYIAAANATTNGLYLIKALNNLSSGGCQEETPFEVHSYTPTLDSLDSLANGCTTQTLDYTETALDLTPEQCTSMKRVLFSGTELAGVTFSASAVTAGEQVRIGGFPTAGTYTIRIYNALGAEVRSESREITTTGGEIMVGTDDLRSGLYMIQVARGGSLTSHRITVTR